MTLISCSSCGKTISSVASKCPKCGSLLSQYRFMQGQSGSLTECRRCAHKVLTEALTCPYCGAPRPGHKSPRAALVALAGLAVPIVVFAALRALPTTRPAVTAPSVPVARAAAPPRARPIVVRAPTVQLPPGSAVTRWTINWANVRQGRGLEAAVVRVLKPGLPIQVSDRQEGWWAAYLDGQLIGYVAGALLGDQPPSGVPPQQVPDDRG